MPTERVATFIEAFEEQAKAPQWRGRVILKSIAMMESRAPRIVEVGVFSGALSAYLLRELPYCYLTMVDNWLAYPSVNDDPISELTDDEMVEIAEHADVSTRFAVDRRRIIREDSVVAAAAIEDASQHLVFIDADHDYRSVCDDISYWWPKVMPNGILAGHDWGYPAISVGVERAVREFAEREGGLRIMIAEDYVWAVQNRKGELCGVLQPG